MFATIRNVLVTGCLFIGAVRPAIGQEATMDRLPDAPVASAQPSPAPRGDGVVLHKKVFWTLVAVDAGSAVADAQTSDHIRNLYPNSSEQNAWLYGRRPGLPRFYATDAVIDGGFAFLSYKLLHSQRKYSRSLGWVLLAVVIGGHTDGWIHNVRQLSNASSPTK